MLWKVTERLWLADLDRAMGEAQLRRKDREAGQVNLFDMMGGGEDDAGTQSGEFSANNGLPEVPEMEELEKLKLEKELLGFFLSGHPVDTLHGLGPLLDTITSEDLDKVEDRRSFRLWSVVRHREKIYQERCQAMGEVQFVGQGEGFLASHVYRSLREIRGDPRGGKNRRRRGRGFSSRW